MNKATTAAIMPMIAITATSSTKVNPEQLRARLDWVEAIRIGIGMSIIELVALQDHARARPGYGDRDQLGSRCRDGGQRSRNDRHRNAVGGEASDGCAIDRENSGRR